MGVHYVYADLLGDDGYTVDIPNPEAGDV